MRPSLIPTAFVILRVLGGSGFLLRPIAKLTHNCVRWVLDIRSSPPQNIANYRENAHLLKL